MTVHEPIKPAILVSHQQLQDCCTTLAQPCLGQLPVRCVLPECSEGGLSFQGTCARFDADIQNLACSALTVHTGRAGEQAQPVAQSQAQQPPAQQPDGRWSHLAQLIPGLHCQSSSEQGTEPWGSAEEVRAGTQTLVRTLVPTPWDSCQVIVGAGI